MSRSRLTKPQVRQKAEEVVAALQRDHDPEVLGVVRQLLAEKVSKPSGRRVEVLWPVYKEMHLIVRSDTSGKKPNITGAARKVAHRVKGVAEETAVGTLRKNYPKFRDELEKELAAEAASEEVVAKAREEAARKAAILDHAFAEDVDTWEI